MKFIKSVNQFTTVSSPLAGVSTRIYRLPDTESFIWYENRDNFHADANRYAQVFENTIQNTADQTSWNINLFESFANGIVVANASTATRPSESSGSNTRFIDNQPKIWHAIRKSWQTGLLQFFPEHQDYDYLDWFKLNQPYVITAQGSSVGEINEVTRCKVILDSISLDVRKWLIDNKRVGDVVSCLMRSNQYSGYLDPLCHRVVVDTRNFNQSDIDLAASITLDTIPPKLSLKVISDSIGTEIVTLSEVAALKRVDATPIRTIVVELEADKPCEFHWIKAQGECTVVYHNPQKSRATITIPFQNDFEVTKPDGSTIYSNRVEVVAVAFDGTHYSSPVFVTEYFTPEARDFNRMNEIIIHADNKFVAKVNGQEVLRGESWGTPYRKKVDFGESNLVEIEVVNEGGPGGLLAALWVGADKILSDSSWRASLDRVDWIAPVVMSHAGSAWSRDLQLPDSYRSAQWLWHPQATETSTVYFRKTIGSVVPVPTPTPVPTPVPTPTPTPTPGDLEQRVAALEETLTKLREALR